MITFQYLLWSKFTLLFEKIWNTLRSRAWLTLGWYSHTTEKYLNKMELKTLNICCNAASPPPSSTPLLYSSSASLPILSQFFVELCERGTVLSSSFSRFSHRMPSISFCNFNSILLPVTLNDDFSGTIDSDKWIVSANWCPSENGSQNNRIFDLLRIVYLCLFLRHWSSLLKTHR